MKNSLMAASLLAASLLLGAPACSESFGTCSLATATAPEGDQII